VNTNAIKEARDLLSRFIELAAKNPKVRNDPVIKALAANVAPKTTEFQTASLTVSTLRNAGCLDPTTVTDDPKPKTTGSLVKEKPVEKGNKPDPKPTRLRGFARPLDVLMEDAVFRGEYPDKESTPIAQKLRVLRKDPLKELEVMTLKAKYTEGTSANGKTFKRFSSLDVTTDATGNLVNVIDQKEKRAVKDISDFDLIALLDPNFLAVINDDRSKALFSWANGKNITVPDKPEEAWPSLKGTATLKLIKSGTVTKVSLSTALAAENFSRYGPSPTLWYKGKLMAPSV